jgi:hypothetical protein
MAGPRYLDPERLSLYDLYLELLYTALRIRYAPEAKALVPVSDKLLADAQNLLIVERQHDEGVVEGEVAVDWRNYDIDVGVGFFRDLLAVKPQGKPGQELFQRFFAGRAAHEVIRMALRPELALVGPWVPSLKAETDIDLAAQGSALEKLVAAGEDAVATQDRALQARRDFDAGPRSKLFENANATRQSLHGELSKLGKPKEWVQSFFRVSKPRRKNPIMTLAAAEAELSAAQAQLVEKQAQLEEVKSRDQSAAAQAAEREKKQKALAEAKKQDAELKRRIAELEDDLDD